MSLGSRHRKLIDDGSKMWTDSVQITSLHQEIAENFYPEVADFTGARSFGRDFAGYLTTSYPLLARRQLGDALSALLRPVNLDSTSPGVWFSMRSNKLKDVEDTQAKKWLEWATKIQREAMYDKAANFVRATKEGDHFFATFGQCVVSLELNRARDTLLYRNWHLRDVRWCENAEGHIDHIQRRWKATATQIASAFGDKVAPQVKEKLNSAPYETIECRHIVIKSDNYEQRDSAGKKFRTPWVSIWIDVTNDFLIEETGSRSRVYIIPRWATVPGSQYAVSPAVTVALGDARLLQSMVLTILEAGEKFADPPMIATQEAVRSDVDLLAGGVTWVDAEYDERLGEVLRPVYHPQAGAGLNAAFEISSRIQESISKAFFLDSLSLPPANVKDMTAYEVGQRISEWIRRAMPIFEPMEFEYNGTLCEETFDILMANGAFGAYQDIPQSLRGTDIQFKFESPLHQSADAKKGQKYLEAQAALTQAAQLDPSVVPMLDVPTAMRDVLTSIGTPAKWQRPQDQVDAINKQKAQEAQAQQILAGAGQAADVADKLGSAASNFASARAQPAQAA